MIALTVAALIASAATTDVIKIGAYGPLTGGSAAKGNAFKNGAHLAAEEINAAGGVLGRKIVLVDADDEAKPEKCTQVIKDLVEKENVVALVGGANTGVASASMELTQSRRVPHVFTAGTGNKVNELFGKFPQNYVFRISASDTVQSDMMVTEAFAARRKTKAELLADESALGVQGRARVQELIAKRGLKPAYVGSFKVGDVDMTAQVNAARAAGAEVLLVHAQGREAAALARSLEKVGWRAPIIGTWNLSNPEFLAGAGPYGDGAVMPLTFIEAGATEPHQVKFIEGYRKRFNTPHVDVGPAAAQAYDAIHLLALAIRQAGSTDGPKVKAALEDLKGTYEGATGSYDAPWRPDDHDAITPGNVVWGTVKGGAVVPDDQTARAP